MSLRGITLAAAVGLAAAHASAQQAGTPPNQAAARGQLDEGADEASTLPSTAIEQVQQHLQQLGLLRQDKVNGVWGPETAQATESFQKAHHIEPTGQPDSQTLMALGVQPGVGRASGTGEADRPPAGNLPGTVAPPSARHGAAPNQGDPPDPGLGTASGQGAAAGQGDATGR